MVLKSQFCIESMHGNMKKSPGPLAPPAKILPSLFKKIQNTLLVNFPIK